MSKWTERIELVFAILCLAWATMSIFVLHLRNDWVFTASTCWNAAFGLQFVFKRMLPRKPSEVMEAYLHDINSDIDAARRLGVPHQWMIDYRRRVEGQ